MCHFIKHNWKMNSEAGGNSSRKTKAEKINFVTVHSVITIWDVADSINQVPIVVTTVWRTCYAVSVNTSVCTLRSTGLAAQINPQKSPQRAGWEGGEGHISVEATFQTKAPVTAEESMWSSSIFIIKNWSKCKWILPHPTICNIKVEEL